MVRSGSGSVFLEEEESTRKSIAATAPPEAQISGGTVPANSAGHTTKTTTTFRTASFYCTKIELVLRASLFLTAIAQASAGPSFYADVLPLFQQHCQACHRPGEAAPMPLPDYATARPWAKAIKQAVLTRKMPPWFADPHFGKFSNDPSLPDSAIQTIAAWVDAGAPEGDPKSAPKAIVLRCHPTSKFPRPAFCLTST
jgi:hypothetical protein